MPPVAGTSYVETAPHGRCSLWRFSLDNAHVRARRNHARHVQARGRQQRFVFAGGAFLAAGDRQHHHVDQLAEVRRIALRQHELDDEKLGARLHGLAAVAKNRQTLIFVPVVDDVRQDIRVAAGGHAARRSFRARSRPGFPLRWRGAGPALPSRRAGGRTGSLRLRVSGEDMRQHVAGGAADIDD